MTQSVLKMKFNSRVLLTVGFTKEFLQHSPMHVLSDVSSIEFNKPYTQVIGLQPFMVTLCSLHFFSVVTVCRLIKSNTSVNFS